MITANRSVVKIQVKLKTNKAFPSTFPNNVGALKGGNRSRWLRK